MAPKNLHEVNQQEMVAPWNTAQGATAVSSSHDLTEKGLTSLQHLGVPPAPVPGSGWGWQLLPTPQSCPGGDVLAEWALLTPSCLATGVRKGLGPAWEQGTGVLQPPQASECHPVCWHWCLMSPSWPGAQYP